jgi:hypothetical protein
VNVTLRDVQQPTGVPHPCGTFYLFGADSFLFRKLTARRQIWD